MNKPIDSLEFMSLWGEIGYLKGYIRGLRMRLTDTTLSVEDTDLGVLEGIAANINSKLGRALGYDKN